MRQSLNPKFQADNRSKVVAASRDLGRAPLVAMPPQARAKALQGWCEPDPRADPAWNEYALKAEAAAKRAAALERECSVHTEEAKGAGNEARRLAEASNRAEASALAAALAAARANDAAREVSGALADAEAEANALRHLARSPGKSTSAELLQRGASSSGETMWDVHVAVLCVRPTGKACPHYSAVDATLRQGVVEARTKEAQCKETLHAAEAEYDRAEAECRRRKHSRDLAATLHEKSKERVDEMEAQLDREKRRCVDGGLMSRPHTPEAMKQAWLGVLTPLHKRLQDLRWRSFVEHAVLGFNGNEGGAWNRFFVRGEKSRDGRTYAPASPRGRLPSPRSSLSTAANALAREEDLNPPWDASPAPRTPTRSTPQSAWPQSPWSHTPDGFVQSDAAASILPQGTTPPTAAVGPGSGHSSPRGPRQARLPAAEEPTVGTRVSGVVRVRAPSSQSAQARLCEELSRALAAACSIPPNLEELRGEAIKGADAKREAATSRVAAAVEARAQCEARLADADKEVLDAQEQMAAVNRDETMRLAKVHHQLGTDSFVGEPPAHLLYDVSWHRDPSATGGGIVASPRGGMASPRGGMASPQGGIASPRVLPGSSSPRGATARAAATSRSSNGRRETRVNPHAGILLEVHTRLLSTSDQSFTYLSGARQRDSSLPWFGIGRTEQSFDADREIVESSQPELLHDRSHSPPGRSERNPRASTYVTSVSNSLPNGARVDADSDAIASRDARHYGTSKMGVYFDKHGPQRPELKKEPKPYAVEPMYEFTQPSSHRLTS